MNSKSLKFIVLNFIWWTLATGLMVLLPFIQLYFSPYSNGFGEILLLMSIGGVLISAGDTFVIQVARKRIQQMDDTSELGGQPYDLSHMYGLFHYMIIGKYMDIENL